MANSNLPDDPLFAGQYHLDRRVLPGATVDLNVLPVWADYTGAGVTVAIVDTAVQADHPDLDGNYDASLEIPDDPLAIPGQYSRHGTPVAGLIAAERNGIGTVGVAYDATIAGLPNFAMDNALQGGSRLGDVMQATTRFDIANHSWTFSFPFLGGPFTLEWQAMHAGLAHSTEQGRDGLGTVHVMSAGNERQGAIGADTNLNGATATRHVMVIGAVGEDGVIANYSTAGATVFTVAPSGGSLYEGVATTDLTGDAGFAYGDHTTLFGGTSAAAPMVSGVVALMLEANPDLGWRDVQEILALSARHAGHEIGGAMAFPERAPWIFNAGTGWNGGGLHVSRDYGFGLVDARAAVRLAEQWVAGATSANEATASAAPWSGRLAIPDNDPAGAALTFEIAGDIRVEHIALRLNIQGSVAGQTDIRLISPSGTVAEISPASGRDATNRDWIYGANTFRGEAAAGTWRVEIRDIRDYGEAALVAADLSVFGAADGADDRHVFTDEFAAYGGLAGRDVLSDLSGRDVLDGAALSAAAVIDLRAGATSIIAGRALLIDGATLIEEAIGGDGADRLMGNRLDNRLVGARGGDTLLGGQGADTLEGGAGNDVLGGLLGEGDLLIGGAGDDIHWVGQASDQVVEQPGGGIDRVVTTLAAYALGAEVEHLRAIGAGAFVGEGNGLANRIAARGGADLLSGAGGADTLLGHDGSDTLQGGAGQDWLFGGAGADLLIGGPGLDRLIGGTGADAFRFDAVGEGVDRVLGFVPGEDRIEVSRAGFGGVLPLGVLDPLRLATEGDPTGPGFAYDPATGRLAFDADGPGGAAPVVIAILVGAPALAAGDIVIIA